MADLSKIELQNLRHLIGGATTYNKKLTDYANNAVDPQVKQLFTKATQDSKTICQICNFLSLFSLYRYKYNVNEANNALANPPIPCINRLI